MLLGVVVGAGWAQSLWELYLGWRQHRTYVRTEKVPPEVSQVLDAESFAKSRLYKLEQSRFGLARHVWGQVLDTAVLLGGFLPALWSWSGSCGASLQALVQGPDAAPSAWLQASVFVVAGTLLSTAVDLPWSLYETFVVEQRHGFNKQSLAFFFWDRTKKLVVSLALMLPLINAMVWIVDWGGEWFFLYLWGFVSVVLLVMLTVYPEFIAPLFDKYTPLPEGPLRERIEGLASRLAFPLTKLYVVEGSKRSAHSNAYLFGFWRNKRIVLFDTLIRGWGQSEEDRAKGMGDDEILAVLGHELGHWSLSHTLRNLFIAEANQLLTFFALGFLYRRADVFAAFGFEEQPTLIGLVLVLQYLFAPYNYLLGVAMTAVTRRMEFQADQFSAGLGYAEELSRALVQLGKDNLAFPVNDPLYSAWNHSHPPIPERVNALRKHQ